MFSFKVCTLLSLVLVASASDLDIFLQDLACVKKALIEGVDHLNISSIEPSVALSEAYHWNGTLAAIELSLVASDLVLYNAANFTVSAKQLSSDSDNTAVFEFELKWDWATIEGNFTSEEKTGNIDNTQNGTFISKFSLPKFIGSISVTKPNSDYGSVNDVQIKWHIRDVDVVIGGLSIPANYIELALETSIRTMLNNDMLGNFLGNFVKENLQNYWFSTGKIWQLFDWCNSN